MAYAEVADVRARAGVLAPAFSQGLVSDPEIERFLDDAAAEIDALLARHGIGLPLTDQVGIVALRHLNAVGALATALVAKFPGTSTKDDAGQARARAQKEWDAAMGPDGTMTLGTYPAVAYLLSGDTAALPTDFWSENPDYAKPGSAYVNPDSDTVNPYFAPFFARTDKF